MENEAAFAYGLDLRLGIEAVGARLGARRMADDGPVPERCWLLRRLPAVSSHQLFLTWDGPAPDAPSVRLHRRIGGDRRIMVTMAAADGVPETAWQRELAWTRDTLLPAIGATDIRPAPVRERREAWSFTSPLAWPALKRLLDVKADWVGKPDNEGRWLERDNDRLGDYVSLSTTEDGDPRFSTFTCLFWDEKQLTLHFTSLVPACEAAWLSYRGFVFDRLMPLIGAADLAPSDFER